MAGELHASCGTQQKKADIHVRFQDDAIHVRSDKVALPAWQLFKLRQAVRRAGIPPMPMRIKLKLGKLPALTLSL